jgi:hypothetical protein
MATMVILTEAIAIPALARSISDGPQPSPDKRIVRSDAHRAFSHGSMT